MVRAGLLALLACSGAASAQVSGSVSLVSDYVYRGVSLSSGNPEAQLGLNDDFASGWFAGAFASSVDLPSSRGQAIAYGGYARQWMSEVSWEAGLSETAYTGGGQNYVELFVGLSSDRLNGRPYYSPDYLGQNVHSLYGEVNFNLPLTQALRLTAHAGYLSIPRQGDEPVSASHGDERLGLSDHVGDWNLQWSVASVRQTTVNAYYFQHVSSHLTGVFDAAWNF